MIHASDGRIPLLRQHGIVHGARYSVEQHGEDDEGESNANSSRHFRLIVLAQFDALVCCVAQPPEAIVLLNDIALY